MIEPSTLQELLSYGPETGLLVWLPRSRGWFSRERLFLQWNTRWAGKPAFGHTDKDNYLRGTVLGKLHKAHRVAWAIHYGQWPEGVIDHINGDPLDNRIVNLRCVTQADNLRNAGTKGPPKSSGVASVYPCGKRWRVMVGRGPAVGIFDTIEQAIEARDAVRTARGFHSNHGRLLNGIPVPVEA